jgi:hypothetical protein
VRGRHVAAHALVALGAALAVAGVVAVGGWPWALVVGGVLVGLYGLLLVDVTPAVAAAPSVRPAEPTRLVGR